MKTFLLLVSLSLTAAAADWPQFRGPTADGVTADTGLPLTWSEKDHVKWKKEIHGLGWSTPLVSEGRIWITTATLKGHEMSILCLDEASGEVLLDRVFITRCLFDSSCR